MTLDGLAVRRSPHGCVWPTAWFRPHASAWAIWSKLCDVNAMTSRSASMLLEGAGAYRSVFDAAPEMPWLLEAYSLSEANRRMACATAWAFTRDAVEREWLRFCPICMAAAYHAPCFQHRAVSRCPVHDVGLLERCPHCQNRIRVRYDAARSVPFGCRSCGRRLASVRVPPPAESALSRSVAATTAALTSRGHGADQVSYRRRSAHAHQLEVGHATWWSGADPFVIASRWRPQVTMVCPGDADTLHAGAWKVLVGFVEDQLPDPTTRGKVLCAADALERRNRCAPILNELSVAQLGMAALVARFGAANHVRAVRLLSHDCHSSLFPLTPQASTVVDDSPQANAIVFGAEVRAEYLRLVKRSKNGGARQLFNEDLSASALRVPWYLSGEANGMRELQWRALSVRRFDRLCASSITSRARGGAVET